MWLSDAERAQSTGISKVSPRLTDGNCRRPPVTVLGTPGNARLIAARPLVSDASRLNMRLSQLFGHFAGIWSPGSAAWGVFCRHCGGDGQSAARVRCRFDGGLRGVHDGPKDGEAYIDRFGADGAVGRQPLERLEQWGDLRRGNSVTAVASHDHGYPVAVTDGHLYRTAPNSQPCRWAVNRSRASASTVTTSGEPARHVPANDLGSTAVQQVGEDGAGDGNVRAGHRRRPRWRSRGPPR